MTEIFANYSRERIYDSDPWVRRTVLTSMIRAPQAADGELFEECLFDSDTTLALLAFLGLKKLHPLTSGIDTVWKEMFEESCDLLVRRASTGPVDLRLSALQALAFAPRSMAVGTAAMILRSVTDGAALEGGLGDTPPVFPLVQAKRPSELPEGFALMLSALPDSSDRESFLKTELARSEPHRLLPVLLSLQITPAIEFTDKILPLIRFPDTRIVIEASRALLACGGPKAFLLIISLLNETADPVKKVNMLPMLAQTGRQEAWRAIIEHLHDPSAPIRKAAVTAIGCFDHLAHEKADLLEPFLKDQDPAVVCEACRWLWKLGSANALPRLETLFHDGAPRQRALAVESLGELPAATAVPILLESFGKERHGDVVRQMVLALRNLLPNVKQNTRLCESICPVLKRLLQSADPFFRSQAAVLCGNLGEPAEDLILSVLDKSDHPHVIASLLGALKKIGNPRLLVVGKFVDHPDPRVRANLMEVIARCGMAGVPYLTGGLKDSAPRVRTAAACGLFNSGQLDVISVLNRMLLIPSPVSVLSGCFALGRLMRMQPTTFRQDHPVFLAVSRDVRRSKKSSVDVATALLDPALPMLFIKLSASDKSSASCLEISKSAHLQNPASYAVKRVLTAFYALTENYEKALSLLESCISEHPGVLADLLDAFRFSLLTANLEKAEFYGKKAKETYARILHACKTLCQNLKGKNAIQIFEKLHHLSNPSMNLYNAMVQLKALEGEKDTVLELLMELLLARPTNAPVARKLGELVPESLGEIKSALLLFSDNLAPYGKYH